MLSNTLCGTSYDWLICKYRELFSIVNYSVSWTIQYRELFSIVNSDFSIDHDTKMAVLLSPSFWVMLFRGPRLLFVDSTIVLYDYAYICLN